MIKSLIHRSAVVLQRRIPAIRQWRNGYASTSRFLRKSEDWSADRMHEWQLRSVNELIRRAVATVPGYQKKYGVMANAPIALESFDDLRRLPPLSKDELRTRPDEFVSSDINTSRMQSITSGGTTGAPTRFMADARTYQGQFDAWRHAMWRRVGYRPGARVLNLTWAFEQGTPLRYHGQPSELYLSINQISVEKRATWLRQVAGFDPQFIVAFPSTAAALAKLVAETEFHSSSLHSIILASELLTEDQREILSNAFPGVRLFCWYGMSEMAGFASGCEHSDIYHFWPQSGIVELLREDGTAITERGEVGELVLTGFSNRITPFIRYRTGDRAAWDAPCKQCGRHHPTLARLEGRVGDFLIGRHGRIVPLSALNFHGDEFRRVFAHQFEQHIRGEVRLRLVRLGDFGPADVNRIGDLVREKLGDDMELRLEFVDEIPRTARGKLPVIIQRCPEASRAHL